NGTGDGFGPRARARFLASRPRRQTPLALGLPRAQGVSLLLGLLVRLPPRPASLAGDLRAVFGPGLHGASGGVRLGRRRSSQRLHPTRRALAVHVRFYG